MWSDNDFEMPTENRFMALHKEEMARDGFQIVNKRKRTNTGQSDSDSRSIFMLSSSDDKLNIIFDELVSIRKNQEQTNRGMLSFLNSFRSMGESINQVIQTTNRNVDMLKLLSYKSMDLEARSRRNNLIFWGLAENYHENCFFLIRDLLKRQLDLDADKMYLTRAHRIGPRNTNLRNQRRPIIVNFRDFCDTEAIMKNAYMFKSTPFSVDYDFPKEISEARKSLWSEVKAIKSKNPRAKTQIIYPAKLIVDSRVVCDKFPDWAKVLKDSRLGDFSHVDNTVNIDQTVITYQNVAGVSLHWGAQPNGKFACSSDSGLQSHECEMDINYHVHEGSSSPVNEEQASQSIFWQHIPEKSISTVETQPPSDKQNTQMNDNSPPLPVSPTPSLKQTTEILDSPPLNIQHSSNPAIFRPFSTSDVVNRNNLTNNKTPQNTCIPSENPKRGVHVPRAMARGSRRTQSLSVPRGKQSVSSGTSSVKKPSCDKNKSQSNNSAQGTDNNNGSRETESRAAHGSKNSQSPDNNDKSCSQHGC